jgi:hypothetical protein
LKELNMPIFAQKNGDGDILGAGTRQTTQLTHKIGLARRKLSLDDRFCASLKETELTDCLS